MPRVSKRAGEPLSMEVLRKSSERSFWPGRATVVFMPMRCMSAALAMLALRTPGMARTRSRSCGAKLGESWVTSRGPRTGSMVKAMRWVVSKPGLVCSRM